MTADLLSDFKRDISRRYGVHARTNAELLEQVRAIA